MSQYLISNYVPDGFDFASVTEETIEAIHALNREMIAAAIRKLACGVTPAASARLLRTQPDGTVLETQGPYLETSEHLNGFWILEAESMDEALAWARRATIVCDLSGEVRELHFSPAP